MNFSFVDVSEACAHPYIQTEDGKQIPLTDPESFKIISDAWLKAGWEAKHVYGFSWLGRPIIQLPDDMIRIQEVIYNIKPDLIIETGVAHGGSLIFYASILNAIGNGRVLGIDIEIRSHNRVEIESHRLFPQISLIEASSTSAAAIESVSAHVASNDRVLVLLDSNHTRQHVLDELNLYSQFVSVGSYIVACDGIMKQVSGLSRTQDDWGINNPISAVHDFLSQNPNFALEEPSWPFNEGSLVDRVTYWPFAFLRRLS